MSLAPIAVERYAIQYKEMSGLLLDFRRYLERENGGLPVQQLETTAALILHDFVQFLGLGAQQREKVLGRSAAAFVDALLDERIDM